MRKIKFTRLRVVLIILSVLIAFFGLSVVSMYLYPYESVQIPETCKDVSKVGTNSTTVGYSIHTFFLIQQSKTEISLHYIRPTYSLTGIGSGVLLTNDTKSAIVVVIDYGRVQFNSTLYIVNKSDNSTIKSLSFSNDFLVATINDNLLYVYNSGLGYVINATDGDDAKISIRIDNYAAVNFSENSTYVETNAFIAGLYSNGGLIYKPDLTFSGIAYGCLLPKTTE